MQFAVMLYFDEATNKLIEEYLGKLKEFSNNDYMLENKMPAHITLAMWNSEYNYFDEIKNCAGRTKAFDVTFSSIGFFNDEERHIFLAPVKNVPLTRFHTELYDAINLPDAHDYIKMYKDEDVWVPHMTIGYQVKKDMFSKALQECTGIKLPVRAKAEKIALAVCCPFKELAVFEFTEK
jgi:2'-5' RNA ligase